MYVLCSLASHSCYGVAFIAGALLIQKGKTVIIAVVLIVTTIGANCDEMSNCDEMRQKYIVVGDWCCWLLLLLLRGIVC